MIREQTREQHHALDELGWAFGQLGVTQPAADGSITAQPLDDGVPCRAAIRIEEDGEVEGGWLT